MNGYIETNYRQRRFLDCTRPGHQGLVIGMIKNIWNHCLVAMPIPWTTAQNPKKHAAHAGIFTLLLPPILMPVGFLVLAAANIVVNSRKLSTENRYWGLFLAAIKIIRIDEQALTNSFLNLQIHYSNK